MHNSDHLSERLWTYDDYTELDGRATDSVTGFASLGFIRAALRRSAWLWRTIAVAGMMIGVVIAVKLPTIYQASTSLLLDPMSTGGEDVGAPITNEQAVAQSRPVAELALNKLGLHQSIASFLASYTVTPLTDRALEITVNAPSSSDAVNRANVLATEFLQFRAGLLETQQQLLLGSLGQQINQDKQSVNSIAAQISQLSAQPQSSGQQAKLSNLEKEKGQATAALTALEQAVATDQASIQVSTDTIIKGSQVLGAATPVVPHSRLKRLLEYTVLGLIGGLVLGLGIAVIRALLSDRLRRRDDVAHALGAPVKLSVGTVRLGRRPGLKALQGTNVKRIVAYLGRAVPPPHQVLASLAVVPADDVRVPAVCLVSLAVSRARQGSKVVMADLCDGGPAARLLKASDPGVHTVSVQGTQLVVVVPERDDVALEGPLHRGPEQARAAETVAAACASADLLLTLATLDPSLGGEHLTGWARGAVTVVTAGRSSAARIQAVGEMIRLAGIPLISGVLIGADKTDESLGVITPPESDRNAIMEEGLRSDAKEFFITVDDGPGRRAPDGW